MPNRESKALRALQKHACRDLVAVLLGRISAESAAGLKCDLRRFSERRHSLFLLAHADCRGGVLAVTRVARSIYVTPARALRAYTYRRRRGRAGWDRPIAEARRGSCRRRRRAHARSCTRARATRGTPRCIGTLTSAHWTVPTGTGGSLGLCASQAQPRRIPRPCVHFTALYVRSNASS